MALVDVRMPQVSMGDNEGVVTEWLKQPGDAVQADESIATIETAKAVVDVLAPEAGVVAEHLVAEGDDVAAGDVLARLETA